MATFSVAATVLRCEIIANRIVATRSEIEDTLSAWQDAYAQYAHVALLAEEIRTLSGATDSLASAIRGAQVVAPVIQPLLLHSLDQAELSWSVMDKQLRRLRDFNERECAIDGSAIEDYENMLQAEMTLFELFGEALALNDAPRQGAFISSPEALGILDSFAKATQGVLRRRDLLLPCNGPDRPSEDPASSSPRPSHGLAPPIPCSSPKPKGGGGGGEGGFFGGLSLSFQAMTANLWHKPAPLVSALCQSAARGDTQQVKGLVEKGADVDGCNEDRRTALICAILAGNLSTVRWLVEHGGASLKTRDGGSKAKTPLFHAVKTGHMEIVQLLLHNGADVNSRNLVGQSHFVEAVHDGNLDMIQILLDHGADSNTRDATGRTVLVHALNANKIDVARQLLAHGADPNTRDYTGQHILNVVATATPAKMDLVMLLFEHGADPNVRDLTGTSLLVHAVTSGKRDLARLLLGRGADPNVRDIYGRTVLQLLVKQKDMELIRVLLDHGVSPNQLVDTTNASIGETLLLHAIATGDDDLAVLLINHGADPNASSKRGHTPLMQALQRPRSGHLVKLLLEAGASSNTEGLCSPFAFAAATGRGDIIDLMKRHGANPIQELLSTSWPSTPPVAAVEGSRRNVSQSPAGQGHPDSTLSSSSSVPKQTDVPPPDYDSIVL